MTSDEKQVSCIPLHENDAPCEEDDDHGAEGDRQVTVNVAYTDLAEDSDQGAEESRENSVSSPVHAIIGYIRNLGSIPSYVPLEVVDESDHFCSGAFEPGVCGCPAGFRQEHHPCKPDRTFGVGIVRRKRRWHWREKAVSRHRIRL